MDFKKIQLTKKNTLIVVYSNRDGDTITMVGANIVHRDFKEAIKNLVPHLAMLTEQREAYNNTLEELEEQRSWEEKSIFTRMSVSSVTFSGDEVIVTGTRVLDRGDMMDLNAPKISTVDDDRYMYLSELSLAIDNVRYEAEQYVNERKWGLKQGELNFDEAGDPFAGVEAGEVPQVSIEVHTTGKKKGRKKKTEVA
nr:MAG TPA: hypothetical protein [Caudoviricetes sp.]